ncbi:MAG: class B sortase [Clostridia bacterium]|nr:class B sortase [Clostridia bacterium]
MKWKSIWIVCSVGVLLVCLVFLSDLRNPPKENDEQPISLAMPLLKPPEEPAKTQFQKTKEQEPYVSPVDFEALWAENADIYAWLDIPDTEITYPLLQHPEDDSYYLRRNRKEESDSNGVIYTEVSYNGKDFSDPLTVIYGHNMNSGQMFGTLQKIYSSQEALTEHSEIIVYLPDRELHYDVFAAVPFDNRHILYNYDFADKRTFRLFFQEILSIRNLEAVYAEDARVQSDEKTLILSTCLTGDRNKRFLVCGKLSETIPAEINK